MYLVSYDISDNRLRSKIAKTLEGYGRRVQYSVFECRLSRKQYEAMYRKLLELMDREEEGSIRIYCLCTSCDQRTHVIGCDLLDPRVSPEEEDLFIV